MARGKCAIFYDYEVDGELNFGETLLLYENGQRTKVPTAKFQKLGRQEYGEPRTEPGRDTFGGRVAVTAKHKQTNIRRPAPKRKLPLHKVELE